LGEAFLSKKHGLYPAAGHAPAVLLDNASAWISWCSPGLTFPTALVNCCIPGEVIRQTLIPLSKQYMTLAAAQADINIPVNATTYVRSQDGSALADEYLNNSGTLQATGRKMPSRSSKWIGVVDSWVNSTIYPFDTLISKNENSLLVHVGAVSSITYREAYSDLADPVAAGDIITVRYKYSGTGGVPSVGLKIAINGVFVSKPGNPDGW
jgi:hypothetical protein